MLEVCTCGSRTKQGKSNGETSEKIKAIENQTEKVLWNVELKEKLEHALEIYQDAEPKLNELDIDANNPIFKQQQRVLSYCLMR